MSSAFDRVIEHPGSIQARRDLAAVWVAANDPRAELIVRQLKDRDGLGFRAQDVVSREIRGLIAKHGREWAGVIGEVATSYRYELGLVSMITIPGTVFVERAVEIFAQAPIQHVGLALPLDIEGLCKLPQLMQVSSLDINGGEMFGDREATMLAACPYISGMRLGAWGDAIGGDGIRAISRSPHLRNLVALELTGNPGVGLGVTDRHGLNLTHLFERWFINGPAAAPYWGQALQDMSISDTGQMHWPPGAVEMAFDEPPPR